MKEDKKKILLYVTFIPYVYIVFMCIYHSIFGYDITMLETDYGLEAIEDVLFDFLWGIDGVVFNPLKCILVILLIGYQIYYFVSCKKEKSENKKSCMKKINSEKIKKALYYISILCWVLYFLSGIFAFFFGSETGGRTF